MTDKRVAALVTISQWAVEHDIATKFTVADCVDLIDRLSDAGIEELDRLKI
jgi:hypothetical protein